MKKIQLTQILTDVNDASYAYNTWVQPNKFAYIVLKDNSLLYISDRDMWYLDDTDEVLYVADALYNETNKALQMPTTGVVHQDNVDRIHAMIDFDNINHVILHYQGEYLGGRR